MSEVAYNLVIFVACFVGGLLGVFVPALVVHVLTDPWPNRTPIRWVPPMPPPSMTEPREPTFQALDEQDKDDEDAQ